jgi:transposase
MNKYKPKTGGQAICSCCGATLIAPVDSQPYWCTECSYEDDRQHEAQP